MLKSALKKINVLIPLDSKFPLNYMIPVYHLVSDENLPHVRNIINYKNSSDFEKDIDFMLKNFDFVDWEFFKNNYNTKAKKPCVLLTFDDGLIEFKDVVMPILLRKGIYAINFINPSFVENRDIMFRMKASLLIEQINKNDFKLSKTIIDFLGLKSNSKDDAVATIKKINYNKRSSLDKLSELMDYDFQEYIKNHKIYMNEEDLSFAKKEGFGIAAHSWDHPYFFDLNLADQLENAQKSINYIKDKGFLNEAFAFPFTDLGIKNIFFEELFSENEDLKFTFGTSGVKTDSYPKNLHRIAMENGSSAESELGFESNYYRVKNIFNKNQIKRL